jgi:hypothetical protein
MANVPRNRGESKPVLIKKIGGIAGEESGLPGDYIRAALTPLKAGHYLL